MTPTKPLCGTALYKFQENFEIIFGYSSVTICVVGFVTNTLNIMVFSRKHMISPTTVILMALTLADLIVVLVAIPYSWHTYLRPKPFTDIERYSYNSMRYSLCSMNLMRVFHGISIWHTVVLAIWRYIAVVYPLKERSWCNMKTTYGAVLGGYVFYPILHVPLYLTFSVTPVIMLIDRYGFQTNDSAIGINTTLYGIRLSEVAQKGFLKDVNFLIYSMVFRLMPSIALAVFSSKLIYTLIKSKKRRRSLIPNLNTENVKIILVGKEKQTDRTTKMLLMVLVLFLITEVPAGIFGFLSLIFGTQFYVDCYLKMAEVFELLTLIYSSITFPIYYVMSGQFRCTFYTLLSRLKHRAGDFTAGTNIEI